jgi:hypothetical protein
LVSVTTRTPRPVRRTSTIRTHREIDRVLLRWMYCSVDHVAVIVFQFERSSNDEYAPQCAEWTIACRVVFCLVRAAHHRRPLGWVGTPDNWRPHWSGLGWTPRQGVEAAVARATHRSAHFVLPVVSARAEGRPVAQRGLARLGRKVVLVGHVTDYCVSDDTCGVTVLLSLQHVGNC